MTAASLRPRSERLRTGSCQRTPPWHRRLSREESWACALTKSTPNADGIPKCLTEFRRVLQLCFTVERQPDVRPQSEHRQLNDVGFTERTQRPRGLSSEHVARGRGGSSSRHSCLAGI